VPCCFSLSVVWQTEKMLEYVTVAIAFPSAVNWTSAGVPPPRRTTKTKNTIWVSGMTKTVPSTKSTRMNPRLVRGESTALVQSVLQNDGWFTAVGRETSAVAMIPQYQLSVPLSRTWRSTRWKTVPATPR
jgi:hypothetical protein